MSEKDILSIGDPFLELREQLEGALINTGFNPASNPPSKEPRVTGSLSDASDRELKNLYDSFLAFYDYLTDELTRCEIYLETTKERADTVHASIVLEANKQNDLTNAEARKSFVLTHPAYIAAKKDYLYFKQLYSAQEQRRKKMSKSMDRLYRELMLRLNEEKYNSPSGPPKPQIKNIFRPVSDD